jgi:hypothetical protein
MAFWNRDKGPQSMGMLAAEGAKKDRSQDIKEQSKAAVKEKHSSDRIQTLFGTEGSLGKSGTEKNKRFFDSIKERFMVWREKRRGEASAKMADYGRNYLVSDVQKVEYQKDSAVSGKVEQAQKQGSEKVTVITDRAERNIDELSRREAALVASLDSYNHTARSAGQPEVTLKEKIAA